MHACCGGDTRPCPRPAGRSSLAAGGVAFASSPDAHRMPDVVITHGDPIEQAIDAALAKIALLPLVSGKRVAVKPNDTWAAKDDTTGITQPDTLRAVLRAIKRHGPRELIVTGGAGAAETDEVFRIGGLMDVVREEGAEFVDHNREPFASVALAYRPNAEVEGPQA